MKRLVCGMLPSFVLAAVSLGCGGGGGGGGGSASSASTASGGTTSQTTTTTTPGSTNGTSTGATSSTANGPVITITSPARASFLTQSPVSVEGSVAGPSPIAACTINGNAVTLGAGGTFAEPLNLAFGLNVITVSATDQNGQTNATSLGVLYGQYQPADQTVENAMGVRLNQGSFVAVQTIAQNRMTGAALAQLVLAKKPLATVNVAGSTLTIVATAASFGDPTITLTPQQGSVATHVVIPNMNLSVNEVSSGGLVPSSTANPTCDSCVVDAQVVIGVSGGTVTTSVPSCQVTLTNFQLNASGALGTVANLLGGNVQSMVQTQLQTMFQQQLPAQINPLIANALSNPVSQPVLGTTALFTLAPSSISIDPEGLSAVVGANCAVAPLANATPVAAPGSLVNLGIAPAHGGPTPDFFASVNQDLINRAGYEVWQSGLTQMTIDSSASSPIQMPASIPLDMGLLQTFLPQLNGTAASTDAIAIQIAPQLPPVFTPMPAPSNVQIAIGELQVQIRDTTTNQLVLSLTVQAIVDGNATVSQNTFDVAVSQQPIVIVSLASSPLAPSLDATGLDNLVSSVLPPVVQGLGSFWQGFPLPVYPGLNLSSVSIFQDGAAGDFLTVSGDVH